MAARITVLGPGRERAAAEALALSHADYPAFRSVFPDPTRRARALLPFFAATVRDAIPFGAVHAALEDTRVLGTAVWLPPGAFPWSIRRQVAAMPSFLHVLSAYPTRFRTFMRYGMAAQAAHPTGDHWYLVVLGIRPEAQRRGLGTKLVEPVIERAARDGVECYLETSDRANVSFYQRLGFATVDDDLALVPGGPTHVAMRRDSAR